MFPLTIYSMPPTNKKPISKAYLNQLVNLYSKIVDSGEDLDHLLKSNRQQYNLDTSSNFTTDSGFKQIKVKMRALRKHSDVIESEYRKRGKGSLAGIPKKDLREYSSLMLQFKEYPEKPKVRAEQKDYSGLPAKLPEPDGTSAYGTFEIYDSKTDEYYYIKYKNGKDFKNKLRKLKDSIGKNLSYNFLGIDYYKSFVDDEFKKFVQTTLGV